MREYRKWDGYSYGKTIPSLQSYSQKITSKMGKVFFGDGFPKQRGKKYFQNFLGIFPLYFSIFLPIFSYFFMNPDTLHLTSHFCNLICLVCLFSNF